MKRSPDNGFTIIELLVVVSITALIGILMPAIGKTRDQAHLTRSQSNLRQLVIAHATYGAEWNDNQWAPNDHNMAKWGDSYSEAIQNMMAAGHPKPILGLGWTGGGAGGGGGWWYFRTGVQTMNLHMPIGMQGGFDYFGYFRCMNVESFNTYLTGRFYDPVFYAPKDRVVLSAIGECMDTPGSFCSGVHGSDVHWSSYVLSPAALFNPHVMTHQFWEKHGPDGNAIFQYPASLRVPTFSQARYPDLKTHMLEHHWLQNARAECNPAFGSSGTYNGCEPYYFNHSVDSVPQAAFYDGHIRGIGVREAMAADRRDRAADPEDRGLWLRNTPFGTDGYMQDIGYPPGWTSSLVTADTSFHILTRDGILGRDTFPH